MGDNMFRLKDRKGADLCLGMTHEEIMTTIARSELRSYKQLPQIWYQIQTKFRDEPRPKSGLLRVRQFIMKDAYSFDIDAAGLDESYDKHDQRLPRHLHPLRPEVRRRRGRLRRHGRLAVAGVHGLHRRRRGPHRLLPRVRLRRQHREGHLPPRACRRPRPTGDGKPELVSHPRLSGHRRRRRLPEDFPGPTSSPSPTWRSRRTAEAASRKLAGVAIFLRGDHSVNEAKLLGAVGAADLRTMGTEELEKFFKGPAGYLGPVGLTHNETALGDGLTVVVDKALEGRKNLVSGANKLDYHLRNVAPGRDFTRTVTADIRNVNEGEGCPRIACSGKPVIGKAVEIGHIFKLGYNYSESMGARVLDPNGKEVMPIMGSYGIGIERILTAAIEQSNDDNGFWLPASHRSLQCRRHRHQHCRRRSQGHRREARRRTRRRRHRRPPG